MGTNFYATEIPTEEKIAEMQKLLIRRQLKHLKYVLEESSKTYHIGKRSCGWQFLFAPHVKTRQGFWNSGRIVSPWNDTLRSIKEYLNRENVVIENEYGEKFTSEEFWKEIEPCLYNDENNVNAEQYYKKTGQKSIFEDNMEYTTDEGLRFSTDEDFS